MIFGAFSRRASSMTSARAEGVSPHSKVTIIDDPIPILSAQLEDMIGLPSEMKVSNRTQRPRCKSLEG
jgi:hypothetical protein